MNVPRTLVGVLLGFLLLGGCSSPAGGTPGMPRPSPTLTALAATSGTDPPSEPTAARSGPVPPPVVVRVADLQVGQYVGVYVALTHGYFESEGLALSFEPFDTAERLIAPMAT